MFHGICNNIVQTFSEWPHICSMHNLGNLCIWHPSRTFCPAQPVWYASHIIGHPSVVVVVVVVVGGSVTAVLASYHPQKRFRARRVCVEVPRKSLWLSALADATTALVYDSCEKWMMVVVLWVDVVHVASLSSSSVVFSAVRCQLVRSCTSLRYALMCVTYAHVCEQALKACLCPTRCIVCFVVSLLRLLMMMMASLSSSIRFCRWPFDASEPTQTTHTPPTKSSSDRTLRSHQRTSIQRHWVREWSIVCAIHNLNGHKLQCIHRGRGLENKLERDATTATHKHPCFRVYVCARVPLLCRHIAGMKHSHLINMLCRVGAQQHIHVLYANTHTAYTLHTPYTVHNGLNGDCVLCSDDDDNYG